MAFTTITAPSPLADVMGNFLHDDGCTFRVWAVFASGFAVTIWDAAGATRTIAMARDSADGYGTNVWSVFVPGVTDGTNYRFVVTYPGGSATRVDPYARSIVFPNWTDASQDTDDSRSVVTSRDFEWGAPFDSPGWTRLVIYQMHIGTFFDPGRGGANKVDDLIQQVPYLQRLGVNAVQLLPYTEFSGALSMGYDPVLPFAMERDYGTPADFKRLVQTLHSAGIAVFVDVVYNHLDTPGGGATNQYSLMRYDGWSGDVCGIYFYGADGDRLGEMDTPFGGPRPNYGRPEVTRFLTDNVMMWLGEYQMDGVRFDSTGCIRMRQGSCDDHCCGPDVGTSDGNPGWELMQGVNDRVDAAQSWKLTVAEDLNRNAAITSPTSVGGAGFDAQWDTDLQSSLIDAITRPTDAAVDVAAIADAMRNPSEGDPFKRVVYLESHDQAKSGRVPDRVDPGDAEGWFARKKSMLAFAVVLCTPGIPMFFQGAELLDYRRWSAGDNGPAVTMDFTRLTRFPKLFQFYADVINLRKGSPGLCGRGLHVFEANAVTKILAFHRWDHGSGLDDMVVVANFSDATYPSYTIGFPYDGTWHLKLNSDSNDYSDGNDFAAVNSYSTTAGPGGYAGMPYSGNVGIAPYSVIVLGR